MNLSIGVWAREEMLMKFYLACLTFRQFERQERMVEIICIHFWGHHSAAVTCHEKKSKINCKMSRADNEEENHVSRDLRWVIKPVLPLSFKHISESVQTLKAIFFDLCRFGRMILEKISSPHVTIGNEFEEEIPLARSNVW